MTPLRGIASVVGAALLAATAHATIAAGGGYGSAHSLVTIAIAAGVAVAALVIGAAWSGERRGLAVWLLVAIIAGEAFGLLMTAERLVAAREAAQAPLQEAAAAYAKAASRVTHAAAVVAVTPTTSPRLEAALQQKGTADHAAIEKSAERGCRENCRALLQAQVDAADREVAAARAELVAMAIGTNGELSAARAALADLKAPASATPLADRVGVPPWVIDLIVAALGSIAANGLGCGLISFAGHRRRRAEPMSEVSMAAAAILTPAADQLQRFAFDQLFPAAQANAGAAIPAIQSAYAHWCAERNLAPLSGEALGEAMADLFERVGIPLAQRNGQLMAMGVTLKAEPLALPAPGRLGRMHSRASVA
jgi:hypothetical protein